MHPDIRQVKTEKNQSPSHVFDNGGRGLLGMKPCLYEGILVQLQDEEAFRKA
jgi:hypothetical protein